MNNKFAFIGYYAILICKTSRVTWKTQGKANLSFGKQKIFITWSVVPFVYITLEETESHRNSKIRLGLC
jgi:hypothetical protein